MGRPLGKEGFRTQRQKAIRWINSNGHVSWRPKDLKRKPAAFEGWSKEISYTENVFITHLSLNCATYRFYSFACNTNLDVVPASAINPANAAFPQDPQVTLPDGR
jgi:hypothetical protein